jgi:transcriptional regulator with XRE-family HTH domain
MTWQRLGQRVRELRRQRGMTQATLADKAAVSLIYVKKLEAGEFTSPSFPVLERIARALKVKLHVELDS